MDEQVTLILMIAGGIVATIGWIWLLIRCFRPLMAFLKQAYAPFFVILVGGSLALFGPVYNKIYPAKPDTSKKEVEVVLPDGNIEISVTIGRKKDLEWLKTYNLANRIQLNNAVLEISDDDLSEVIAERDNLTFIDLSDNPVTDATLERLVKMPNLKKLYAARTKITADGVTKFVLNNPNCKLTEIDFRGLTPPVQGKTMREWKEKDKDNRKFNN